MSKVQPHSSGEARVGLTDVLRFVWPVMLTLLASTLQGLIDSIFVGRCGGPLQLAALAPATSFLDGTSYMLSFIAIGTLNVLAVAGAEQGKEKVEQLLSRSLMVAAVVGCVAAVAVYCTASGAVFVCGARGAVVPVATGYVKVRAIGLPLDLLFRVANAGLLSTRDSRTGLLAVLSQSVLNAVGDAVVCPALGIYGAALTTLAAQAVGCSAVLFALWRRQLITRFQAPSVKDAFNFLGFALPVCITLALKVASVQFLSVAASAKGVVGAAAHQITKSLFWVFGLLASESLSSTAQAFLPKPLKSNDLQAAAETLRLLLGVGAVGAVATAGLLSFFVARNGLTLFCHDSAVLSAVPVVPLCCCLLLTPFTFCIEGAHIAAQRQRWLSRRLLLLTSCVGFSFKFGFQRGASIAGVWSAFACYLLARGVWYSWGLWGRGGVLTAKPSTVVT